MTTIANKTFKVGILGLGGFGSHFIPLFKAHPLCSGVAGCERLPQTLAKVTEEHELTETYTDFDEMLKSNIDAVAIFTQRWSHAPYAIKALKAGKHVYSAVPAAVTLEELDELVKTVEETGLTYTLGETSFYRCQRLYCRERFARGDFGRFVYGEGHYYHDMAHWFYRPFFEANGADWKQYASIPPIWYPTHSVSHVLGVTMSRMTHVSCYGYVDSPDEADGLFDPKLSHWGNAFSNQSALFRTADGGMVRINEFRRCAAGESRQNIIGTLGAYQEQPNPEHVHLGVKAQMAGQEPQDGACHAVFTQNGWKESPYAEDGSFDYAKAEEVAKRDKEDVSHIHHLKGVEITRERLGNLSPDYLGRKHLGVSDVHPVERLPAEFVGMRNGHAGSHQFLVQDFFEAMATGKLPPNHIWISARYNAPGIVAHESCQKEGERLSIPDFGKPSEDAVCIDPLVQLRD